MTNSKPKIWQLQAQFDIQGLIRALQHDNAGIRKRAAAAIRAMRDARALDALREAFAKEQDADARASMAAALELLDAEPNATEEAAVEAAKSQTSEKASLVNRLIQQLESEKTEEVIEAAHQLGDLDNKLAVEPLVMMFRNAKVSIQVRLAVADALLKLESAPVEVTLLATLRHSDWHIRRNGAAILGQLKADWAVPPLASMLRDPHPVVRRTARAALKFIGTPEARRELARDSVRGNDPNTRKPKLVSRDPKTATQRSRMVDWMERKKKKDDGVQTDKLDMTDKENASKAQTKPIEDESGSPETHDKTYHLHNQQTDTLDDNDNSSDTSAPSEGDKDDA